VCHDTGGVEKAFEYANDCWSTAKARVPMVLSLNRDVTELMVRARIALGMTQGEFGDALGSSQRTASRWDAGESQPSVPQVCTLAAFVYPKDSSLARELAAAASETLESLGIVQAPAPSPPLPPLPTPLLVDAVVCAAADVLQTAPSTLRGALHAAFGRARALRLTVDDVEKALAPVASKEIKPSKNARS
jgi:DNA-binding XRE family transcriptional regulator